MKQNLIIRASAGTGKTFSLATRFIRLMMLQDVAPERIVALTFSRAAAQEIYTKLLDRLWSASASEEGARREKALLLQGLNEADLAAVGRKNIDWSAGTFSKILRNVIATQYHGSIATLDSFILKIVRSFPLEMGFQNAVDVLDGFGEKRAIADAQSQMLDGVDTGGNIVAAFKTISRGEFVRTCATTLDKALFGWRNFLLEHPECREWTSASMRHALGVSESPCRPDVGNLPVTGKRGDPFGSVVTALEKFTGGGPVFPKTKPGEFMRHLATHPDATSYTYQTDSGKEKTLSCTAEQAETIRAVVRYMLDVKLGRALDVVHAKLTLCRMIEKEYDASTRKRGLLTFADFTGCQALSECNEETALNLENLQFRFDSRFDHWALDEFQDTSELQWICLKRLVQEAAQPDANRSVMAVGDLKQSIYTWRGGNDAPFKEMMNKWPEFKGDIGEIVPNDVSYRYEKNTADFINRVFGVQNVRDGDVLNDEVADAVNRWLADDCWMEHHADVKNGCEKCNDFVEVISVPPPGKSSDEDDDCGDDVTAEEDSGGAAMKILAPGICSFVADFWAQHECAHSTDTVGILVRNNRDGMALAERLRAMGKGLPVVWEGTDGVLDAPVVRMVLELLKLAEHPGDTFAWQAVNALFPIREIVFPNLDSVAAVSREVAKMLTRMGLARTLKEIVSGINTSDFRPDERSVQRLEALVREGVNYERRCDSAHGILNFIEYLKNAAGHEVSTSPHVIRILTIHRSKGLTIDHVIVPILETGRTDTMVKPRRGTPFAGDGWALDSFPEDEIKLVPKASAAWRDAANERVLEHLRTNYVALTRARKSTHVFVCADDHGDKVQFRDLLLKPFEGNASHETAYGNVVCEVGEMPPFGQKEERIRIVPEWIHESGREHVVRKAPSAEITGASARFALGALFEKVGPSASARGTSSHERYAQIGWIDAAAPKDEAESAIVGSPWREAFVKPESATALWRERAYEIFAAGVWETGQFDRVVFYENDGVRRAVIYDFKTNVRKASESEGQFAARLAEAYRGQMTVYRRALSVLTGIPLSDIAAKLLLEATRDIVSIW